MATSINILAIKKRLLAEFGFAFGPPEQFGPDGWFLVSKATKVFITNAPYARSNGVEVVHASISHPNATPTYRELAALARAVWPNGYCYQFFVPAEFHVNIHEHALHIWGALDGKPLIDPYLHDAINEVGMI